MTTPAAVLTQRYVCGDQRRLRAVKAAGVLNGIEYVEVSDSEAPTQALRQRTLFVRLLLPDLALGQPNVTIGGGERLPDVPVEWVAPATALPAGEDPALVAGLEDPGDVLVVRTGSRGDFSQYTLRLVAGAGSPAPPAGFDPLLTAVEFSFKVECPSDFDCAVADDCPPERSSAPAIDYLAKDYASFRRLMLDRLSLLAPGWRERSAADVGVTLVELLAYLGDELSYRQDAVATEAYLATARRRPSLRRHARLVDYVISEGCNARAWVQLSAGADAVPVPAGTPLLTRVPGLAGVVEPGSADHRAALGAGAETFETVEPAVLYAGHDRLDLWTWGDAGCCLPRGATAATLLGHHPRLKAGDVLVLQEVAGPDTGNAADADPARRAAVRLTSVVTSSDPSGGLFADPPSADAVDVTEVAWDEADALSFPLCVSVEERPGLVVSEARGNVVLADHGRRVAEPLGLATERFRPVLSGAPLTSARPLPTSAVAEGAADAALVTDLDALTFTPLVHDWLEERGFTFRAGPAVVRGGDGGWSVSDGATVAVLRADGGALTAYRRPDPASGTLVGDARTARPAVELESDFLGDLLPWLPRADLLASSGDATEFVVEREHDGTAVLRFGDGVHGRRPDPGTAFAATYRVGNGTAGNVGAGALAHVVSSDSRILGANNPMAASGGTDPEPAEAIRRDAPEAFLVQQRAVTAEDYARVTERNPAVQRATATFRWTGSWHTVFVTADRMGGLPVDRAFETSVRAHLEPFRMAGYDLEVDAPHFVPLEVGLHVCVLPDYFRAHVKAAVVDAMSSGVRADGSLGLFHPDRFTFAQPVYLSAIVAAVQELPGVQSVVPTVFQRQRDETSSGLDSGVLRMGRLEIARLDANPSFPERGVLTVTTGGGK